MAISKTCKQCQKTFVVEDDDLTFYKKISPTFAGKTFDIPPPTLCPECRDMRRYGWRNERTLYRRKCDKTKKDIVAMYPPDSKFTIWANEEWYKDSWDPVDYGRKYDSDQPFFQQFYELIKSVPRPPITLFNDEGCNFCNFVWNSKDCYLCFSTMETENCMYSWRVFRSKNCVDCLDTKDSQYCYGCLTSSNCYKCQHCERCIDCNESYFSFDCRGCGNIFMCTGLRNKKFYIRNKQYSQEEYSDILKKEKLGLRSSREKLSAELDLIKSKSIFPENFNYKCENCEGDHLIECKNCRNSYFINKSEDCKNIYFGNTNMKNCMDCSQVADAEYCYEILGGSGYKNIFCPWPMYGHDNLYCNHCENCTNCFGCFGLKRKQYCILNKKYSKGEYEDLAAQIIEKMTSDDEWGELFPLSISPFAYNETMANLYYPKSREQALGIGAKWQDKDFSPKYEGPTHEPEDNIGKYIENDTERQKLLSGVLKCKTSNKPYKILPQELAFYIENEVPVPDKHYDVRYKEKLEKINPRRLWHRQCMCEQKDHDHEGRCKNEFETTYAPERPEKVYCEKCYQQSVI